MNRLRIMMLLLGILSLMDRSWGQNSPPQFCIRDGETVVFYGDSITAQRLYTSDVENFVLTRYPYLHVQFINSGVGGDTVNGGLAGPVYLRLERDVFPYHPDMVTIFLGWNDGYGLPFAQAIETTYQEGYRRLVAKIQERAPQSALTLLKPTPFDDVTRAPDALAGYNTTMLRFGGFVGKLAEEQHTLVADLYQPVVDTLAKAKSANAAMSTMLVRDRIHPGSGIQWLLAEAILRAWHATGVVTSVRINSIQAKVVEATNTSVIQLHKSTNALTWNQSDHALPLPFAPGATDPFLALVLQVSDLNTLNQELLRVEGLPDAPYELQIDEQIVGAFTSSQLAAGVNLSTWDTPMLTQSRMVAMDTEQKNEIENMRFTLAKDVRDANVKETIKALDAAISLAIERQHKDAQPIPHRYSLTRRVQSDSGVREGKPGRGSSSTAIDSKMMAS
jgi:lysophospholipase L1-like esterase